MVATRQKASQSPKPPATRNGKRPVGRPPKVTLEVVKEVAEKLALGVPKKLLLDAKGVKEQVFDNAVMAHPEFHSVIAHARAEFVDGALRDIRAKEKGWQGPAWILERRYTEHFGVKIQPNVQVNVGIGLGGEQMLKIQQVARQQLGTARSQKGKLAADWQRQPEVVEVEVSPPHSQSGALPAATPEPSPAKPEAEPTTTQPEGKSASAEDDWQ